jgi:D-alanine transaminase
MTLLGYILQGRNCGDNHMTRTVYLNGEYLPEGEAKVSIFDRGFLMADGVYEVTSVIGGKLVDFDGHAVRLSRSLRELMFADDVISKVDLLAIHRELIVRNDLVEGMIYLQITRGAPADRDFVFPDPKAVKPTIVLFTQNSPKMVNNPTALKGLKVISIADERWGRRDIKTVQLLYPSMGKMMAKAAGADDAWLVEDGFVTEGTSNNAYIVKDGAIITRELSNDILHGITRAAVLRFAKEAQMTVEERNFTIAEAQNADEAFITSASTFVMPVVNVDGADIGTGAPGPVAARLREIYLEETLKTAV